MATSSTESDHEVSEFTEIVRRRENIQVDLLNSYSAYHYHENNPHEKVSSNFMYDQKTSSEVERNLLMQSQNSQRMYHSTREIGSNSETSGNGSPRAWNSSSVDELGIGQYQNYVGSTDNSDNDKIPRSIDIHNNSVSLNGRNSESGIRTRTNAITSGLHLEKIQNTSADKATPIQSSSLIDVDLKQSQYSSSKRMNPAKTNSELSAIPSYKKSIGIQQASSHSRDNSQNNLSLKLNPHFGIQSRMFSPSVTSKMKMNESNQNKSPMYNQIVPPHSKSPPYMINQKSYSNVDYQQLRNNELYPNLWQQEESLKSSDHPRKAPLDEMNDHRSDMAQLRQNYLGRIPKAKNDPNLYPSFENLQITKNNPQHQKWHNPSMLTPPLMSNSGTKSITQGSHRWQSFSHPHNSNNKQEENIEHPGHSGIIHSNINPYFSNHNEHSSHLNSSPKKQNLLKSSLQHHHHHSNYNHSDLPQQKQRRHHVIQHSAAVPPSQVTFATGIIPIPVGNSTNPSVSNQTNTNQQNRSAPDILKTLLRKKACLYETDTSRAVALITWLTGRRMALNFGYFSRQQLQSGVHHVVAPKISAGIITRTKVNRCMQIILNSCFHYIIPRPDGEEEKGDSFRKQFAATVKGLEDDNLVQALPVPWNDLDVGKALEEWWESAEDHDDEEENGEGGQKRTVLLCFNENVRSSDDVFRCHNEFIRDAANSANLMLTAEEWKLFFAGGDQEVLTRDVNSTPNSPSQVAKMYSPTSSPRVMLMPSEDGIMHTPHLLLPSASTSLSASPTSSPICSPCISKSNNESATDEMLGRMSAFELKKFRTTWCSKRYDHDPSRCGFAHADINYGWLRRDPDVHPYRDEMCPKVYVLPNANGCLFNACPKGIRCEYAHSREEMHYHPNQYKKKICPNYSATAKGCELRDICPFLHPSSPYREDFYKFKNGKNKISGSDTKSSTVGIQPKGVSMLYIDPAPFSDFDKYLQLPGLQDLFRRRSNAIWSYYRGSSTSKHSVF